MDYTATPCTFISVNQTEANESLSYFACAIAPHVRWTRPPPPHVADAYARLAFFTRLAHCMIFVGPTGNMRITRGGFMPPSLPR